MRGGDGCCDGAGTNAPQPSADRRFRFLILFAGDGAVWHALPRLLREAGHSVTAIDTKLGGAAHDVLRGGLAQRLLRAIAEGEYDAVFAAPPCSSFSVRHPKKLR